MGAMKSFIYNMQGTVERYAEASRRVNSSGDCAIVVRGGVNRQLVLRCPDGCGEILSVNLDARSGPAWRLYKKRGLWSLFPSIDRTSGCLSHFILLHGHVLWCGAEEEEYPYDVPVEVASDRLLAVLRDRQPTGFFEIAEMLDEIPW